MEGESSMSVEEQVLALKGTGNEHFKRKNYEEAVEAYSEAIKLDPKAFVLFSNRSLGYFNLQKYEEAIQDARECVRLNEKFEKGHVRLAQALVQQKKYAEAEQVLLEYEARVPGNPSTSSLRESVGSKRVFAQLEGPWFGTVGEEMGGYMQVFHFLSETKLKASIFGREMLGNMKLRADVNGNPGWMDLQLLPGDGQPDAPEILHIFKLENNNTELHLCSPYMTAPTERPTKFEGPTFVIMRKGLPPVDEKLSEEMKRISALDLDSRCTEYAERITQAFPNFKQFDHEVSPDSPEAKEAAMASMTFQKDMYDLEVIYGPEVMEKTNQYLQGFAKCDNAKLNEAVSKLFKKMQESGMIQGMPETDASPNPQLAAESQSQHVELSKTEGESLPSPAITQDDPVTAGSSLVDTKAHDKVNVILAAGVVAVAAAAIALLVLNRSK